MKKKFTLLVALAAYCSTTLIYAQTEKVYINDNMAILNADSKTKGILPPRMSMGERSKIPLTAGILVYCTDCTPAGPYSYNGTTWLRMFDGSSAVTYTLGQDIQGGKVFWLDTTKQHGLVAATTDQNGGVQWSNGSYINTQAVRSGVYSGFFNTNHINDKQGSGNYAALIAASHNGGGFGDWYLPSKDELSLMYQARTTIGNISGTYWSSTETIVDADASSDFAYIVNFSNGTQTSSAKNLAYKVRAIRRF